MPSRTSQNVWEDFAAEHALKRFDGGARNELVDRLEAAVQSSRVYCKPLGLHHSRYPGEDDGLGAQSESVTLYILDHLLRYTLDRELAKIYGKHECLLDLIKELEAEEFLGVVLLYANRVGDHDIFVINPTPYLELLRTYRRRRKGGLGKGESIRQVLAERDAKIREKADTFRAAGRPKYEIASVLAERHGISPQHIRRILKKTNMR